jgi:regulatory protein
MAMTLRRQRPTRPPLTEETLEQAALRYVARYATTRAKLTAYLAGKVEERGWAGASSPPIEALAGKMVALGYVDDRAFARARAAALGRRGYGARRIDAALRAAGVEGEGLDEAQGIADEQAWESALRLARRKRIGPFAPAPPDRAARERAFATLVRAGHPAAIARRLANSRPGEIPDEDGC